ncbi:S-layer homology domain-containing protein [Sporosarcina sp. Sa2YVA2]|uniref:S-layer homology domain-containing protein n=1 Tax=Sporosarcina quadrami TaxID=2762234 RepID=A0ABR8U966_9BACL|nr:S-layer homology domain-containing protein [Sporosarcina quadrami]MBD7984567.1 S-layer homology domain-containing protein [Sporosarcina quadrami]
MIKKLFISAITATFLVPAIITPVQAVDSKQTFKDVKSTDHFYSSIEEMVRRGAVSGYPDGTFRPGETISRKHVASLLGRVIPLEQKKSAKSFKDVSKTHPYYEAIRSIQQAGIMDGDSSGNFNPDAPVTRVQLAKLLELAFGLEVKSEISFSDVPASHWGTRHVQALYSNGITKGDGGRFNPGHPVTRAQYAVFLQRLLDLDRDSTLSPPTITPIPKPPAVKPVPELPPVDPDQLGVILPNPKYVKVPAGRTDAIEKEYLRKYKTGNVWSVDMLWKADYLEKMLHDRVALLNSEGIAITYDAFVEALNDVIKNGSLYVHPSNKLTMYYSYKSKTIHMYNTADIYFESEDSTDGLPHAHTIKTPADWEEDVIKEHERTITNTVFKKAASQKNKSILKSGYRLVDSHNVSLKETITSKVEFLNLNGAGITYDEFVSQLHKITSEGSLYVHKNHVFAMYYDFEKEMLRISQWSGNADN